MDSALISLPAPRTRWRHSPEFKARIIEACLQPGISIAAVALANQRNTNFVRKWVKAHREQALQEVSANVRDVHAAEPSKEAPPTFVPVTVQSPSAEPSGDIRIEIRRQQTVDLPGDFRTT
ncbi:transposase [Aromatoleum aromaticum]|uniref:transposase n=1 Tax=Aromatoleum aromaticum TaxID=551760 RepID=UPI00083AB9A2|nr:transposase [Aromatoleum aromaticum]